LTRGPEAYQAMAVETKVKNTKFKKATKKITLV
jgi:hypothetical protein